MNKDNVQLELLNKLKFSKDDLNKLTIFHETIKSYMHHLHCHLVHTF